MQKVTLKTLAAMALAAAAPAFAEENALATNYAEAGELEDMQSYDLEDEDLDEFDVDEEEEESAVTPMLRGLANDDDMYQCERKYDDSWNDSIYCTAKCNTKTGNCNKGKKSKWKCGKFWKISRKAYNKLKNNLGTVPNPQLNQRSCWDAVCKCTSKWAKCGDEPTTCINGLKNGDIVSGWVNPSGWTSATIKKTKDGCPAYVCSEHKIDGSDVKIVRPPFGSGNSKKFLYKLDAQGPRVAITIEPKDADTCNLKSEALTTKTLKGCLPASAGCDDPPQNCPSGLKDGKIVAGWVNPTGTTYATIQKTKGECPAYVCSEHKIDGSNVKKIPSVSRGSGWKKKVLYELDAQGPSVSITIKPKNYCLKSEKLTAEMLDVKTLRECK